jgi:hypothetical protein
MGWNVGFLFSSMLRFATALLGFCLAMAIGTLDMAERVGFEALNVEPCAALRGLVRTRKTKHLSEFRLSRDLIDMFRTLIHTKDVARVWKM